MTRILSRYPVAIQIGAGFLVGVVLLAVVAAVGISRVKVMRDRANEAAVLGAIGTLTREIMVQMNGQASAVRGFVATGDPTYVSSMKASAAILDRDLATLDKSDQTDAVDSARLEQIDIETAQIESDIGAVKKSFDPQLHVAGGKHAAVSAAVAAGEPLFEKLRRDDDALLIYATTQAKDASTEFERALAVLVAVLIGSTVAAVILLVLTALAIGGGIARRLATVTHALVEVTEHDVAALTSAFDRLSSGDLSASFESERAFISDDGRDEIAVLAQSYNGVVAGLGLISLEFNKMTQTLRTVISGIVTASNDLANVSSRMSSAIGESTAAVEQISISIVGVADGARSQAERIVSANGQIDDLSQGARRIATGSDLQARASLEAVDAVGRLNEQISAFASLGSTLANAAGHAQVEARTGEASVAQTAHAMTRIKEATGVAQSAMKTLETSSSAVSDIVSVIDDMADQTNLLALNAAIEAARAGDQGRGFAVVADEVRKLAEKSRISTAEIIKILDAIRAESVRAAHAIATASDQMDAGMALSLEATNALGAVGAAITQTAGIAAEVASRSAEMEAASNALTQSISSVSRIIDENAATAEGVRETSDHVLATIVPVAASAEAQAATAEEVSSATQALSMQIQEMHASSRTSRQQSEALRKFVSVFRNVDVGVVRDNVIRIAAALLLAIFALRPHPAGATTEFARRTLLSCNTCHTVGTKLSDFGKAFKANRYVVPRLVPRGDVPVTLQAQSLYSSDPDPTGLPKFIVDKVILLAGGPLGPHFNFGGQQYVMDGGNPGDLREAWLEYSTSWVQRIPIDARAGLQVMPLPADPQRFKLSQQDYALFVQTVGNNPFNLYEPMNGVRLSLGQELHGLNFSTVAFDNHDQGSPFPQSGTDWMFAAQETFPHATLEAYRYTGRRALPAIDEFWRQGFGANYYTGRFTLDAALQTGNDTNPLGTGQTVVSSGGYLQGIYQLGGSTFLYAREDGVNDTTGNFQRDFVGGAATFLGRAFKLQIEDVLTHTPQTHNSLAIVFGIGLSTIHQGSSSY